MRKYCGDCGEHHEGPCGPPKDLQEEVVRQGAWFGRWWGAMCECLENPGRDEYMERHGSTSWLGALKHRPSIQPYEAEFRAAFNAAFIDGMAWYAENGSADSK